MPGVSEAQRGSPANLGPTEQMDWYHHTSDGRETALMRILEALATRLGLGFGLGWA